MLCLTSLILYIGFDHNSYISPNLLRYSLHISRIIFVANVAIGIILDHKGLIRRKRTFMKIVDALVLLTAIPWFVPATSFSAMPWLGTLLHMPWFIGGILATYSVVMLSIGVIHMMGQRTNPSLILSFSFVFFIAIGSFALMLPKCTVSGISYTDSLFVATSAVCITGLTPVDISATFTPLGLTIIAILMQTGALGVMTFTSFFALFFSGNSSMYSQLVIRDMIYTRSINALFPTLLYIFGFTLIIETVGAMALWWSIHGTIPEMTINDEMIFAAFHSVSAFCN
ncbi:MAG: potassium transporter, partial [Muribaculaceae bacterium]|nr:potassium transporter [Muribaculaceae bacterium]